MSWLSGLAGKAEDMLNRLDQNAAVALQKSSDPINKDTEPLLEVKCDDPVPRITTHSFPSTPKTSKTVSQKVLKPKSKPPTQTETLIQYLNNDLGFEDTTDLSFKNTDTEVSANGLDVGTENLLLKNELSVVTNELSIMSSKLKSLEKENKMMDLKLERLQTSQCIDVDPVSKINNDFTIKDLQCKLEQAMKELDICKERTHILQLGDIDLNQKLSQQTLKVEQLQKTELDLKLKIELSEKRVNEANQELQQYRTRVHNTLLSKEKLIEELKNQSENVADNNIHEGIQLEVEQLKMERDMAIEETVVKNGQADALRVEIRNLELSLESSYQDSINTQNALHDRLIKETTIRKNLEEDFRTQHLELRSLRDELSNKVSIISKELSDRELELNSLRQQYNLKQNKQHNGDLEDRIHTLTQSLVSKQNALEMLTGDRNALRLQLEQIENKHRTTLIQLRQSQILSLNDTDDAKSQVPNFLLETPFDTTVARRVKRVYSSLDAFGIRTGVFLRRYPMARILVICYMVLLHLWVMVVLCTSSPN